MEYSTVEFESSSVVHVIVAYVAFVSVTDTEEIVGAVRSVPPCPSTTSLKADE